MHISFLEYLVDPETKETLILEETDRIGEFVITGKLIGGKEYPIIRGIPRFTKYIDIEYVKSFSYQWNKWSKIQFDSENVGKPMQDHTCNMWEKITGLQYSDLSGQIIGDFGCGPGRFIEVVRKKNGKVIGIDNSFAVEATANNFHNDKNVLICQADILHSPIKENTLDGAFTIGVLHHTPNPSKAFSNMVKTVKPLGWIASSVYGKGGYYNSAIVQVYRKIFKFFWPIFGPYLPLMYSYFASYLLSPFCNIPFIGRPIWYLLLRQIFPFINLPDKMWSVLDTFDSLTTYFQSGHDTYEIFHWYKVNGLINIEPTNWGHTSFRGIKPLKSI